MLPAEAAVIHLPRRTDRASQFEQEWIGAALPVPLTAWNGIEYPPAPAAGCFYAHLSLLFATFTGPLLVLEDDAAFTPGFTAKLHALNPPPGWDLLYLGGDHLTRPTPAGPGLVKPGVMRRSHAYIARHPQRLAWELARRLPRTAPDRDLQHLHIDAALTSMDGLARYAADPALVHQSASRSDITGLRYRYPPRQVPAASHPAPPRTP